MNAYWKQFPSSELRSMVGADEPDYDETDPDIDIDVEEEEEDLSDVCPKCQSSLGCNYCLMTEW
jgi:hypothetical protein